VRLWRNLLALGRMAWAAVATLAATPAGASMFSGEALDAAADVLAIVVLILVPLVGIAVFWIVHVLPEKIAHKRHHPQRDAIQTLCLLSLVFGGLLWPIAWLWAYTRPVTYKMAYGTDRHEDYYEEMGARLGSGGLTATDIAHLREDLAAMEARGALSPKLRALKTALDDAAPGAGPATGGPA